VDRQRLAVALAEDRRVTIEAGLDGVWDPHGALNRYEPLTANESHLTILHIGKLAQLASEIGEQNPRFHRHDLLTALDSLARALNAADAAGVVFASAIEDLPVGSGGVRVIRIRPGKRLASFRTQARDSFLVALGSLGIRDAEAFAAMSPSIAQYSPLWLPHVTLKFVESPSLRPRPLSDVRMRLTSARLRC
jgi:hypothetical protein